MQRTNSQFKKVFVLIDLVCCGAILLPVVWSIRHLQVTTLLRLDLMSKTINIFSEPPILKNLLSSDESFIDGRSLWVSLKDASSTDGKAAVSLEKLKLFRHFYIMVVCYVYFTRSTIGIETLENCCSGSLCTCSKSPYPSNMNGWILCLRRCVCWIFSPYTYKIFDHHS